MTMNLGEANRFTWLALALVWLIGLAFTKRTVRSQPDGPRVFQMAVFLLGFVLVGSDWLRQGWLGARFMQETQATQITSLAMTVAGCALAIWARLTLGGNWSGRVTVKEGHELIVRGPYSLARHPIYTGILLACVGTCLMDGEWHCLLGLIIVALGLVLKMSQEERLMMETFPQAYPMYRQRVKALIPGVF
jgi:protein-S-isoprenylcysteine O-methyltransferase Ste14